MTGTTCGRKQSVLVAVVTVAAFAALGAGSPPEHYPSPIELALSPDGSRLFVACDGTDEVVAFDAATGRILRRIAVGHVPKSVSFAPDGRHVYTANSWADTVSEIDATSLQVVRTLPGGSEPTSAITDRAGAFLYVANRIGNDVSLVNLTTGKEIKRLLAGRGASYLERAPQGDLIYSTHIYPNAGTFRAAPESEITVIDSAEQHVVERLPLHNSAGVFHVAMTPDGRLGMAAELRPKNLAPLAHVEHGWAFGNSIAVFGDDVGEPVHVPIDELDRYFTPPYSIAIAPDGSTAYVSTTGSDSITVIDIGRLKEQLRDMGAAERRAMSTDLSASANYVTARIAVGDGPKGLALSPNGKRLYVANRTGDSVSVIDAVSRKVADTWGLGGPKNLSSQRRGERLFYSARFAFQGHMGCANCHIEGTIDGLNWDLEPDGFGKDIVDNRSLEDIAETAPFKWNGGNADLETECGPRTEKFFWRAESYSPRELADLVSFVKALPLRPNRNRLSNGAQTPAQERGKTIFERTGRRDGTPIPEELRCPYCHSGTHYTNNARFDVGTGKPSDRSTLVDVPQLRNVAFTAPYLHDGSARTLEEIWTVFNPRDTHGVTNDLAKNELNDLIEYLKSL